MPSAPFAWIESKATKWWRIEALSQYMVSLGTYRCLPELSASISCVCLLYTYALTTAPTANSTVIIITLNHPSARNGLLSRSKNFLNV